MVIAALIWAKHDGIRSLVVEGGLKTNNFTQNTVGFYNKIVYT